MVAVVVGAAAPKLGYRPELDALRSVAAVLVFVHHAPRLRGAGLESGWLPAGGWVGVTMFFALSGYLITSIMLRSDRFSLGDFYVRRARRLLPAMAFLVAGVVAVAWLLDDVASVRAAPWAALYGGNLRAGMGWFGHTWSLGIEEHFYLVWPLVFVAARRRLLEVTCGLIVLSVGAGCWMFATGADMIAVRNSDLARSQAILIGCVVAILAHRGVRLRVPAALPIVALAGMLLIPASSAVTVLAVYPATAVCTVLLIAAWTDRPPAIPAPMAWFGKISYGFYLWHYPVLIWLDRAWSLPLAVHAAIGFALTLWLARVSWVFVEQPWRRQSISIQPSMQQ